MIVVIDGSPEVVGKTAPVLDEHEARSGSRSRVADEHGSRQSRDAQRADGAIGDAHGEDMVVYRAQTGEIAVTLEYGKKRLSNTPESNMRLYR